MDTSTETNATVKSVRQAYDGPAADQPKPEWIRSICPLCAGPVVSNCYYVGGRGYLCVWEGGHSLGEAPTCSYRKVL